MYCFYCTTHAPFHQSLSCRRERYPDRYCERYPDQRAQEKPGCKRIRVFFGGRGWIRTTEALSSRFTVCPHWPLGNTPLFGFGRRRFIRATCLFYHRLCVLSTAFFIFFSAAGACRGPLAYCSTTRAVCQQGISARGTRRQNLRFPLSFFRRYFIIMTAAYGAGRQSSFFVCRGPAKPVKEVFYKPWISSDNLQVCSRTSGT